MKTELTENEMRELGWSKSDDRYFKEEDGAIVCADALANGNAPVGGQHYEIIDEPRQHRTMIQRVSQERERIALRLASKATIGEAQFSEQPCLDPDLYPRDLFVCFVKGRVAGARSFIAMLPLTKAAFHDDGQRNAIASMARDNLRLDVIPRCLANNQWIVGPRGRLPK